MIYPNPVENNLYLQLLDDHNQITLNDITGRIQLEAQVNAIDNIDMTAFKSGIYFLTVKNTHGTQNYKVIKR